MLNGKAMIVLLTAALTKRFISEYFPEPKSLGGRMTVELDLPNYATKADLKNAADVDTSKFANLKIWFH